VLTSTWLKLLHVAFARIKSTQLKQLSDICTDHVSHCTSHCFCILPN